jgi:endonuclease/exonuclease/phosphatase family metal-dependent hydrolase
MHLRVLTLNVWNDNGDPRRFDLINRELHWLDPDLIALQEVLQSPERSQLDALLAGMDHQRTHQVEVLDVVPPGAERFGGNAIATRWPHRVVEVLDLRLPDAPDVPWATLAASVRLPGDDELLFIAPTMAWRLDAESARQQQVLALTDLDARHRRALPTVVAGDFNASPEATSIRYLTGLQAIDGHSAHYHDAWAVAGDGPGYTWGDGNPNAVSEIDQVVRQPRHRRRIDYVFVGSWHAHPDAHAYIRSAAVAFDKPDDGVWASDHLGVVVDLEVGRDAG